ncbi:Wzz/FepE/Etk N-terminal domain-containing protein [Enterococcus casseliflavus]|uniref:YveK family protein n=1 Tax=Enterococcus casseliflavus TaxID=37734 RepID=UPI0022561439|nr:Wzz/FepE/Etk N-terminal domain-containing protein [Enterococcus casseliflavus]MCX4167998.1 Wzz/FepE/Etk N-terminal domain-containing protein [Enterococcus casseliflavus]
MEETISLEELWNIFKKRFALILVSTLLGIAVAGGVTFFLITPMYSSSAEMIVQAKAEENTNLQSDISGNVLLINTYKDMINGVLVIKEVQTQLAEEKNYSYSVAQLKDAISVAQSQNSQMFQIVATSDNPVVAADIANTTANVFKEKAGEVLDVTKVTITSEATIPTAPISPNNKLNLAIGFLIGFMIGVGLAFLLELMDKTVKDEDFVSETLELPVMGSITEMSRKELHEGYDVDLFKLITNKDNHAEDGAPSRRTRKRV